MSQTFNMSQKEHLFAIVRRLTMVRNGLLNLKKRAIVADVKPECSQCAWECNENIMDIKRRSMFIDWNKFTSELLSEEDTSPSGGGLTRQEDEDTSEVGDGGEEDPSFIAGHKSTHDPMDIVNVPKALSQKIRENA